MNSMPEYLKTLTDYNYWANKKIISFVLDAGADAVNLKQVSSFDTIKKTVYHIWDAESIWLDRLHHQTPNSWPSKSFDGDFIEACAKMTETSMQLKDFVESMSLEDTEAGIHYKNIQKEPFSNTMQEVITHVVNHGTFHRGQLVTMLRVAGYTHLQSTDLITYYRDKD
jgi:uncharacterized damage-inducible protein DinB